MKKQVIIILIAFFFKAAVFSQSCLPQGITLNTQEEIDNFQTNFPGCTEIEGSLNIAGTNITNLTGLSILTAIGEDLYIYDNNNLTSLIGLNYITTIEGIYYFSQRHINKLYRPWQFNYNRWSPIC